MENLKQVKTLLRQNNCKVSPPACFFQCSSMHRHKKKCKISVEDNPYEC